MTISESPADCSFWQGTVGVVENVPLARDTYRLRVHCPEIAGKILPGQFVMLRLAGANDPLLGRPLALYETSFDDAGSPGSGQDAVALDVVYLVVGKLTSRLARLTAGAELEIWGPLGHPFVPPDADHLVMVAGGIGQTPFLALAQECLGRRTYGTRPAPERPVSEVTFCYGARSADLLAGVEDFRQAGVDVKVSTDDGLAGHHGLVTDLLTEVLSQHSDQKLHVVCCGPEPMMAAVARITAERGVSCDVSLETPMACGIGICFSCVAKVRMNGDEWDYRRTCVEGPVFDARQVLFD